MRAAVWKGADRIATEWVDTPDVPNGWALVEVSYTGLCGTDLAILRGQHPRALPPLVMGHEFSGTVVRSRDESLSAGDLVIAEPLIGCGACWACRNGHSHVCRTLGLYGIDRPGGLAQYVALPAQMLHVVPSGTDHRIAALVEPLAVAVHAVAQSSLRAGDIVAVFGAGPIGVLTALVARLEGASTVVIAEPNPWRAAFAEELGFTVVPEGQRMLDIVRSLTDGEGADVTFDTAGHPSVSVQLTEVTRVLGTAVIVGVHKRLAEVDLRRLNFAEQRMQGTRVYRTADIERAIELVVDRALGLERIPLRVFSLDDIDAAFRAAESGERNLKVMVDPSVVTPSSSGARP